MTLANPTESFAPGDNPVTYDLPGHLDFASLLDAKFLTTIVPRMTADQVAALADAFDDDDDRSGQIELWTAWADGNTSAYRIESANSLEIILDTDGEQTLVASFTTLCDRTE